MAESSETQLAVLLFTDIVGSVALQSRLGTAAYTRYITRHDAIFKTCLNPVSGARILNETGDGFLVRFRSASDAVETALRLQCLLRQELCEGEPMNLRIGLHMGEVAEMEEQLTGEKRAVGMAINVCARIMDLAEEGQILLTRAVFDEARQYTREHPLVDGSDRESLPPLQWPAHGRYLFKGTDEPMEIYEVGALGLAPLRPPEDGAKAKRAVAADEEATLGWRPGVGLPIPRHEKWVIAKKLGQGGFGEVWLARHADTGNERVFKFCFDPERLRSFKRELTLFRLLRDALGKRDDIAALYEVSVESPPFYLESEYVPAGNLALWAQARGGLGKVPLEMRIDLMTRTARALAAAHSVGIIHKDIKPSNILIHEENGRAYPRIADFGIGTLSDAANLQDHNIPQMGFTESIVIESDGSGGSSGTQLYMAPEYLIGAPASVRGDVYSLGVMLYQVVAGDLTKPMGSGWHRDVPDPLLREDIRKCVDVAPELRFESATDLANQLDSLDARRAAQRLAEEDTAQRARQQRQAEKRRRLLTVAAVALFGLLGIVAVLFKGLQEQRDLKEAAKVMAGQADYFLANEHLKQGEAGKAVARLARALRSDPHHPSATARLTAALAYHVFPQRLYPPVGTRDALDKGGSTRGDFSSDGRYFAGLSGQGGLEIWECATGQSLHGILAEDSADPALLLRFYPDASRVFVKRKGSYDIILLAEGKVAEHLDLQEANYGLNHAITDDGRYWIADHFIEPKLHVHALFGEQRYLIPDIKGTNHAVRYAVSPDGRYLALLWDKPAGAEASKGGKGILSLCDLQGEEPAWRTIYEGIAWASGPPPAVAMDPNSHTLAFGTRTGEILLHALETGDRIRALPGRQDFILTLAFSPDAQRLGAGYFSQVARVWEVATGEPTSPPLLHEGAVFDLAFSADGIRMLTASLDLRVRLWDPGNGILAMEPMLHDSEVLSVAFDDTGKRALTISLSGLGSVWDIGRLPACGTPLHSGAEPIAVSEDLQRAVVLDNQSLQLVSRASPTTPLWSERAERSRFHFCRFRGEDVILGRAGGILERISPDGAIAQVAIDPLRTPSMPFHFRFTDYHPDTDLILGMFAISLNNGPGQTTGEIRAFGDPANVRHTLKHPRPLRFMEFAPSGRYVLTAVEQQAYVWDLEEPEPQPRNLGVAFVPTNVALAEDVPRALIGTITGATQLWDLTNQQALSSVLHHDGPVMLVDINADATVGLTLSLPLADDQVTAKLRAWNLVDSTPITPPIPVATPPGLSFVDSPDIGEGLLTLSEDASQAIVSLGPGYVSLIDLSAGPTALAPANLAGLAEALSGYAVNERTGRPVPLTSAERAERLAGAGAGAPEDADWQTWFAWLRDSREDRPIAPTSTWTEDRYLKYLMEKEDVPSLMRALTLSPNNPRALAKLASATLDLQPNPARNALAAFYVKRAVAQMSLASHSPVPLPFTLEQAAPAVGGLAQHGETFCVASAVCLRLGNLAAEAGNLAEARHHYRGALQAAVAAYERDAEDSTVRAQLAQTFLQQSRAPAPDDSDPEIRGAFLDAAILTLSLLAADDAAAGTIDAVLAAAGQSRWPVDESTALVPSHGRWRYQTTSPGADTPWFALEFDDSSWPEGAAPMGYGEDYGSTVFNGRPPSAYLRHRFTLTEPRPAQSWMLKLLCDDGAEVYLDGAEIHRENMARDGTVLQTRNTPEESRYHERELVLGELGRGEHLVAVAVHQIRVTSSDLMIDLGLYPETQSLAAKLRAFTPSRIDALVNRLPEQLPPTWARNWKFYLAEIANAANPLAQQPGALYRRALVQESRGRLTDALSATQAVIRLSSNDPQSPWTARAESTRARLSKSLNTEP